MANNGSIVTDKINCDGLKLGFPWDGLARYTYVW